MTDLFVSESKIQAKQAAYAAVEKLNPQPTSVVEYKSRGHVVIIAASEVAHKIGDLPDPLTSEIIEFQGRSPTDEIAIEGALGQFLIKVSGQTIKADLILDLTPQPLLTMGLKPPGYITSANDLSDIESAKAELREMVGTFEKPRYFDYNESLCAHGRSGKAGCTRCIDACPAEAITSLVEKIKVDPFRCQGGGICTTVCPSSALTYAFPKPKDLLAHIRTLIVTYLKQTDERPDLVFATEDEQERVEQMLPAALVVTVEEVASVGPEMWFSALAWGARSVRLFDLDGIPETSKSALNLHLGMAHNILEGMSYPENCVSIVSDQNELMSIKSLPLIATATHAPVGEKRQSFYMALDHLVSQADKVEPIVSLPEGSIFGEALIDQSKCTLCMSCVSACPGNALQDGREMPQVSLIEEKCLQCNVCVNTCPEDAISITPRFLFDRAVRMKSRVLHQDEPFCCTKCGKPFATSSGIATIMVKLAGHSMFADERSRSRLKMCDDCRVVDMMEDPNTDF
ncbi:4Fe-4S binding protein [Cocleimonas flava]|uniref:4Fe-4S dicluster protein n=1 Tax=Cocleimonas flava TaxID=634765 RepID=A0A4R1F0U5_9GAMM|nr:4Fe-4S binding protein [Cocleimonas flava]TCJ87857.1 4Fe-4S dicluster protein [Cocleimonas flava]